ncbi:hypothetical protein B0I27_11612 [Arcticibacter pallidicorallinus]|uniref:Prepilin-type N-terminal cleavage/methylation domain-containing protein n=1 Tax=Arcticibacter pallidicorallinus TaxID=1259464 RepID=A0A2T0TRD7_9SPHI|nr:hypothetical protein [Arcticibacter pallidicorallinus]PRY48078.1 hypothetical protein B0I27_11612 [Arcticibacter pallidicorallinus]
MAKIATAKVSGSTLIEVVIATVIILVVFTLAIGIFTKVTQSGYSVSRTLAHQQMESIIDQSIRNQDYEDEVLEADSINYEKIVVLYSGYDDLLLLQVEASQGTTKIGKLRKIVRREEQ